MNLIELDKSSNFHGKTGAGGGGQWRSQSGRVTPPPRGGQNEDKFPNAEIHAERYITACGNTLNQVQKIVQI